MRFVDIFSAGWKKEIAKMVQEIPGWKRKIVTSPSLSRWNTGVTSSQYQVRPAQPRHGKKKRKKKISWTAARPFPGRCLLQESREAERHLGKVYSLPGPGVMTTGSFFNFSPPSVQCPFQGSHRYFLHLPNQLEIEIIPYIYLGVWQATAKLDTSIICLRKSLAISVLNPSVILPPKGL